MRVIFLFKRLCLILCFALVFPNVAYAEGVELSASSAIVMDAHTNTVFFEKNSDIKRGVASTTKVMTCLLAVESGELEKTVEITDEMLVGCEGSLIYLKAGDRITLYDLVCGAMIASGNDAANAIAYYLAGSQQNFAIMMNKRAKAIGMKSTKFVTPSGLDKGNNHSTAFDMALLSSEAAMNDALMKIASMKSADITISGKRQTVYNHNKLLSVSDNFIGLKTGFTKKAGRCLLSVYQYKGSLIVCVTLGAPNDWQDHKRLVNYSKKCYKDINQNKRLKINTVGGMKSLLSCGYSYSLKAVGKTTVKEYYYPFVYAPVRTGDVIGRADIYINQRYVKSIDITSKEDIKDG